MSAILNNAQSNQARNSQTKSTFPHVDVAESENGYLLIADLPGLEKSDISIIIEDGVLRIDGERKFNYKQEKEKYAHFERSSGKFSRSFVLPDEVEAEKIEAKMSNGVLELIIPKAEIAKPKKIDIKII
jgi:HSP20 family protein